MPGSNGDPEEIGAQNMENEDSKVVEDSAEIDQEVLDDDNRVEPDLIEESENVDITDRSDYPTNDVSDEEDVLNLEAEEEEDMFVTLDDNVGNDSNHAESDDRKADSEQVDRKQQTKQADQKAEPELIDLEDETENEIPRQSKDTTRNSDLKGRRTKIEFRSRTQDKRGFYNYKKLLIYLFVISIKNVIHCRCQKIETFL